MKVTVQQEVLSHALAAADEGVRTRHARLASPQVRSYLTVSKAARFLGCSPETLRRYDRNGKYPARRSIGSWRRLYTEEDLGKLAVLLYGEDQGR